LLSWPSVFAKVLEILRARTCEAKRKQDSIQSGKTFLPVSEA
jgi:hypothetical protein